MELLPQHKHTHEASKLCLYQSAKFLNQGHKRVCAVHFVAARGKEPLGGKCRFQP